MNRIASLMDRLMIFAGNANPRLAQEVVKHLNLSMGRAIVGKFSDGEVMVEIMENVRGKDVFVLQSTCAPTNDNLMELLVMVDALKRSSAARVTAAIPYFGYARQDRRPRSARVAISAKVVANMLASVGVARVLTMDLHADQIQGFFDMPVDNVYAAPVLLGDVWKQRYDNLIVVSPDVGGVVRARALAKRLESDLAIIDKRRPKANVSEVMNVGGAGAQGGRRHQGGGLLHAPGALRRGGGAHRRLRPGRAGGHRHHPAARGRARLQEDPAAFRGGAAGGDDPAHLQRGFGQFAVHRMRFFQLRLCLVAGLADQRGAVHEIRNRR
jgi:hypothetical protein